MGTAVTLIAATGFELLPALAEQVRLALWELASSPAEPSTSGERISTPESLQQGTSSGSDLGGPALDWLGPGKACDIHLRSCNAQAVRARMASIIGSRPVDAIVQPSLGRRKSLLVADMESTVIGQEMLDVLGELIGCGEQIRAITTKAMNGLCDFGQALRERTQLLAGVPLATLELASTMITPTPGARSLVQTVKAHSGYCILASGGFSYFTERVAKLLGFDEHHGNRYQMVQGQLSGQVLEPIIDSNYKRSLLLELASTRGLKPSDTVAVGDGANDLAMLLEAGFGVAYRAKPVVAEQAPHRVDHCDLTALLYAQGYRQHEIVT